MGSGSKGGLKEADRARDRDARQAFFQRASVLTPYLAVARGRRELLIVPTSDTGIGLEVFVKGGARNDMKVLGRAVRALERAGVSMPSDPVFVDVGANLGTTTVSALLRRGFSSAVALEPSAENIETLRLNLVANAIDDRVRVLQAAASDAEGEVFLELSPLSSGCHRIGEDGGGAVAVEAVTLDGLVSRRAIDPARVGLLWLDTQGHESNVLRGASKLLELGIPLVTAARNEEGWADVKADLHELLAPHYTSAQNLRKDEAPRPISDLPAMLEAVKGNADLLLFRLDTEP